MSNKDTTASSAEEPATVTSSISLDEDIEVASSAFYSEELEEEKKKRGKRFWFILIASVVLFGVSIAGASFVINNLFSSSTPEVSPAPSLPPVLGEPTNDQELVETVVTDTVNVFALQLVEQFGEDVVKTISASPGTNSSDEFGNPATVALTSLFPVPEDFNVEESVDYFKSAVSSLGENWVFVEDRTPVEGVTDVISLRMWEEFEDGEGNPYLLNKESYRSGEPFIIIDWFKLEGDPSYVITVSAIIYPEN